GVVHTAYDIVAIPVDLVGTAASSQWTPRSYYGTATQQAMQEGTPWYQLAGEGAVNAGTLGLYGLVKAGLEWNQTGDPTGFQQAVGPFALGAGLGYAGEATGILPKTLNKGVSGGNCPAPA